jgi:ubiquinone biosynthesis accessory factor UbiJ
MDMSALAGVTAALEGALNGYLELDPDSRARLAALRGGVVGLRITGLGATLYFVPGADRLQVALHYDGEPDTLIIGSPLALARLGLAGETTRLPEGVRVEGDARLGQQFRDLLRGVELDWEEWLSRLTGDLVAHQVGEAVRGFTGWSRHAAESLRRDMSEYLREESGALPTRDEVEAFMDDVDRLREDTDRLEAHIARLERRLRESGS